MTPRSEMEAALEAILFAAGEPVPKEKLLELFTEEEQPEATAALETVLARFGDDPSHGVMVDVVAGGVRLATRPELAGWLRRFFDIRGGNKLSMAALETLAIIAYRQPITGPEIQELRGVSPSGVLKTLLERHMVRIAGRKAVVGNPFLYRTTREFLVHFGLNSLKDLPPLEELEEVLGEGSGLAAGAVVLGELEQAAFGHTDEETAEPDGVTGIPDREEEILKAAAELDDAEPADEEGEVEAS